MKIVFIFLGGALGALFRYIITSYAQYYSHNLFPFSILTVNILGSFLFGLISSFTLSKNIEYFFLIGFLGALTTFSSYANEMISLLKSQKYAFCFFHIFLNNILCFGAIVCGKSFAKNILL